MNTTTMVICGPARSISIPTGHHPTGGTIHPGVGGIGEQAGPIITIHGMVHGIMDTHPIGILLITAGITGIPIMIPTGIIMTGIMERVCNTAMDLHLEKDRHIWGMSIVHRRDRQAYQVEGQSVNQQRIVEQL